MGQVDVALENLTGLESHLDGDIRRKQSALELVRRAKEILMSGRGESASGPAMPTLGLSGSRLDPGAGAVFAVAKKDPVSGEPIYDPRVVKGYRTNRQRVLALTRVYGPTIRGRSAGRAIFESGETRAASVESAAANLNVLAKHRTAEFVRDSGTYTYRGELEPDLEMIALVTGESGSVGECEEGARMVESQDQNGDGVESTSFGAATGA